MTVRLKILKRTTDEIDDALAALYEAVCVIKALLQERRERISAGEIIPKYTTRDTVRDYFGLPPRRYEELVHFRQQRREINEFISSIKYEEN